MRNAEQLHELETFSHFSAHQLHQLSDCLSQDRLQAGATVFGEGDQAVDPVLLDRGALRLRRMTPFGHFDLARLSPGTLIGDTGFIDGQPREADAEAMTEVELVRFDAAALGGVRSLDQKFDLALHWAMWKSLSQKLRDTNQRLAQFFTNAAGAGRGVETPISPPSDEGSIDMASKLGLFREQKLSEMEINFLASLSREERFTAGQPIFREGDKADKMYVVAQGTVLISKRIPGVGEEALSFLERGDYFGEMALIEDRPRSADAKAHPQSGATVLALPHDVVHGILDIHKVSSIRLLRILSLLSAQRLRGLYEKLTGFFLLAGGDVDLDASG